MIFSRPFCPTAPARRLLGSEGWAKHEDDEADAYFTRFVIQRKEKRLLEKVQGRGKLRQAYIEYIAEKQDRAQLSSAGLTS